MNLLNNCKGMACMSSNEEEQCLASIGEVMSMIGGNWSFLVLGQLFNRGPHRFNQLKRSLGAVSTKSLTDILRHLESHGIIRREVFPIVPVTVEYALTDKGADFQKVLLAMREWRQRWGEA